MSDVRQRQQRREQTEAQARVERRGEKKQQQTGGLFTPRNVILAIAATGAVLYFASAPEPQRWIRQRRSAIPSASPTDFFTVSSVDRTQAPSACAAQGGSLAPVNSTNFNVATTAAFNSVGANKPLWIQSWNTDSYGGNVMLYTGNKAPGGAVNVGVATDQIAALCIKTGLQFCEDVLGTCKTSGCGANAQCFYEVCSCDSGRRPSDLGSAYKVHNKTATGDVDSDTSVYVAPTTSCDVVCSDSTCPEVAKKCNLKPDDTCFPGYAEVLVVDETGVHEERFENVKVGDKIRVLTKQDKQVFDEVVYVFRASVKHVTYTVLEYVAGDGTFGEIHLTPSHMIPNSATRNVESVFVQAKEVRVRTYIRHATHGPVVVTAISQRLIRDAGAYTAITRTPGALLIVDGVIASPWAVCHHLLEWTFGPIARGVYAILKPMGLHGAVLGSRWIADVNDLVGPAIMRTIETLPRLVGEVAAPIVKM